MDRSLAARLGRPFAAAGSAGRGGRRAVSPRRRAHSRAGADARTGALAFAGWLARSTWRRRPLRRRLLAFVAVLPLLGGGWLWLRDSPLVAVEHVQISGVQGVDAGPIEAALQGAARGMSTLDVNVGALRAAVAPFRVVRDLSVSTSFPHGLRIRVVEQLPVAVLACWWGTHRGGRRRGGARARPALERRAAAGDHARRLGAPLTGACQGRDRARGAERAGRRATDAAGVGRARCSSGREGLTVAMRNGLSIYFGDATRPHAKWLSAARVLADSNSAGATYVDVRAPERPAAGTTAAGGVQAGVAPGR